MTCIAAYVDKEKNIWMGGDSIAYGNYKYNLISQPKVFLTHNMIIGYTSSFRMGQILQYDFDIPKHSPELTDNRYMVSVFIDKIIERFEKKKYSKISDNQASGGVFLIGYNQKLYRVDADFQVTEMLANYNSVGCGENFSNAAFWTMEKRKMRIEPRDKVYYALECASNFSLVKEPFHILMLKNNSGRNL